MIKIVGYQGVSLIDFPGRIATVLFTPGCNFACPFCQNPELVNPSAGLSPASPREVEELLETRKKFIDGVSITGGEPTLLSDLPDFLKKLKGMNLQTKVDTNGYLPKVIKSIIDGNLVDFIAMDIKASLEKYQVAAGTMVDISRIEKTIDILIKSDIEYEFRTTVVPGLHTAEDIKSISRRIEGAAAFRLHQFSNKQTLDSAYTEVSPYLPEEMENLAKVAGDYVADVKVRGI